MGYIFLDTETGGIGNQYSLLSAYFLAANDNFNKVDELELLVKPDDGAYVVCGQAMNVNRIDLKIHDTKAIIYREAGTILYNWLKKLTDDGKIKAIIVGHSISGDRDCICRHLLTRNSWEKFTSYRLLDTQSTTQFLKACGLFPESVSGSLESISKYFGIKFDQNDAHSAKYDTEKTREVFLALKEMVIKLKSNE
jgi:DNA polymerase III alpha subunit (gram-positive type)